jgi:hypothetical protein
MFNKAQFLSATYLFNVALTIIAVIFKIYHYPNGELMLTVAILAMMVYVAAILPEILGSTRIGTSEKLMWITGLLFLTVVAGYLYIFKARQRILNTQPKQ